MRDLWTSFSVPITVSGIGLLLVILLGLAPLMGRNTPPPQPAASAAAPAASPVVAAAPDPDGMAALQAALNQQSQAIDSLTNRVRTLEKGITRLNVRQADQAGAMDTLAALAPDVNRTMGEVAILNKAVPRLNARLTAQSNAVDGLPDLAQQVAFLEGQMRILNVAIPRLQSRIKTLQDAANQ